MSAPLMWAALAGIAGAAGLLLAIRALPILSQPRMVERIAPYVRSSLPPEAELRPPAASLGAAAQILTPTLNVALRQLDRFSVNQDQLRRRLVQAGLELSVSDYRLQQLISAAAAAGIALLAVLVSAAAGRFQLLMAAAAVTAAAIIGILLRDQALTARIRRRRARMIAEFPTIAEMLALAVSAGESAPGAFERISRTARGELAGEFSQVIRHVKAGETFTEALRALSSHSDVPQIARFLEGLVVAVERGTPLAEVLRAQAADVREVSKRELMEAAGRKEIGMLVPVVFGILPLTIIFAIFPGLSLLQIGL